MADEGKDAEEAGGPGKRRAGNPEDAIRHDPAFKTLFLDFPEDTVRWLLPQAVEEYGKLEEVRPLRQEPRKRWLSDRGRELDLPLLCRFERGALLLVLIEHQHDKRAFSVYKLAHYTLDMMEAHPGVAVVPVVVFADPANWRKDVARGLVNEALGRTWLKFEYRRVKLKEYPAREMLRGRNPVPCILVMNFGHGPEEKVELLKEALLRLYSLVPAQRFAKYLDFMNKYGRLTDAERGRLAEELEQEDAGMTLSEVFMKRGLERGLEKGLQKGRREGRQEGLQKGRREGRQEGLQKGRLRAQRDAVLRLLDARFGSVDKKLRAKIVHIEAEDRLDELLVRAATAESLAAFRADC